jgi:hypothetical protein
LNLPNTPVHSLVIDAITGSTLYAGTETGVFTSADNGTTWSSFAVGMPTYVPVDELVLQSGTNKLFAFTHGRSAFVTTNALPVTISSFVAAVNNGSVKLEWTTLSEVDNYGFEVDQSGEPSTGFTTIAGLFVPGHGTTLDQHSYSVDVPLPASGQMYYRLRQIDLSGTVHFSPTVGLTVTTSVATHDLPQKFRMSANYPNPFNPSTTITFEIAERGPVRLDVFDITGRTIATLTNDMRSPGVYSVKFDGSGLASGMYIARLVSGKYVAVRKMLLTK